MVSHLAQVQSPFLASPPCAQYSVFSGGHSLHLAFGSFFYPHPSPRFIFKLINQFDRCLVPLAWGLMAGGCRFASYGGVTLSRGWLCQKWKPLDIPGTHLHYVTVVNFVFNCTRTGAPITTGTYQNACWYPIYSVEDDIYHLCLTSPGVFNSFGFCQVETFVSVL